VDDQGGELIVYQRDSEVQVQLGAGCGTVRLLQRGISDLYATSVPNIKQIISRVLADGEVTAATLNSKSAVDSEYSPRPTKGVPDGDPA
jgi:hypothetical protein